MYGRDLFNGATINTNGILFEVLMCDMDNKAKCARVPFALVMRSVFGH